MQDVARALILPDVEPPNDGLLKTLALYWDELVVPTYRERLLGEGETPNEPTMTFQALTDAGIVTALEREVRATRADEDLRAQTLEILGELEPFLHVEAREQLLRILGEEDADRLAVSIGPATAIDMRRIEAQDDSDAAWRALKDAVRHFLISLIEQAARHYLLRVDDSTQIADANALAPVGGSAVAHVASLVARGVRGDDAPEREAALVSAAADAFAVRPDTPVEEILRMRERHAASMARLRAALVDLSASLRSDASGAQLLANARDTFRNRVVPALGELEAVLAENRIAFFVKSLVGATALTVAPVDPVRTSTQGVRLASEALSYRFSKERLVEQHPFGYLHHLSGRFDAPDSRSPARLLDSTLRDPALVLRQMLADRESMRGTVREIWGFDV